MDISSGSLVLPEDRMTVSCPPETFDDKESTLNVIPEESTNGTRLDYEIQRPERPGETTSHHGSRRSSCCSADDENEEDDVEVQVETLNIEDEDLPANEHQKSAGKSEAANKNQEYQGDDQPLTDRYGFFVNQVPGQILPETTTISIEKLRSRERKWMHMIKNWQYFMDEKFELVKTRCRKGIPPSMRGQAWMLLCGGLYHKEVSPNRLVFDYCINQDGDPKWIEDIQKDLNRQFPEHEMFSRTGKYGNGGKDDLFNLLKAYTVVHPEEGYCQGQAPIAAVLLMHMPVRDAFYCFVQICHKYLPGYYSQGLEAIQIDGDILNKLLKDKSKLTYRLFKKNNIDPILYMVEWFMCVYCRTLPWPTVLRVWDMFLCEGIKIMFKVALVLLKYGLGSPTQCKDYPDMHAILMRLKNLPPQIMTEQFIVEKVCEMTLNDSDMEKLHFSAMKLRQMRFDKDT